MLGANIELEASDTCYDAYQQCDMITSNLDKTTVKQHTLCI